MLSRFYEEKRIPSLYSRSILLLLSLLLLVAMVVLEGQAAATSDTKDSAKGGAPANALDALMKKHLDEYERMKGKLTDIKSLATCVARSVDEGEALMKCNEAYLHKSDPPDNAKQP